MKRDNTTYTTSTVHPQSIIVLDRGDYTSCTVNLHGATVTSWRINNQEMIFISRECHFTGLSHIRGGIQFVFPIFGAWNFGPPNGFATLLPWKVEKGPIKLESGDIYAMVSLSDNPLTRSLWNFRFKLYYEITLYEKKIVFHIDVENPSPSSYLEIIIMQYALMKVPDVTKCEIIGFKGCLYKDMLRNNKLFQEDRDCVTISGHTDRIYYRSPNTVIVRNAMKGGSLKIMKKRTMDVLLWNPWIEQSVNMGLANDEYQYFIAVEAGVVSHRIRLVPLSCWAARQTFEYVEPPQKPTKIDSVRHFYDLFDGYC